MPAKLACIAGEEAFRQWRSGRLRGESLGPRPTPFGPSGETFLVESDRSSYYILGRHGSGMGKPAPRTINDRANIYALKHLGVQYVLGWGPGGAVTHDFDVGDLVILNDLIDFTYLRDKTFFPHGPLGYLREWPVFCPSLRRAAGDVLHEMKLLYHGSGTVAVREGPRLETPAEVRMLATIGTEIVTHVFVPEVFLARELELCYAGLCYVVNYAETGSRHRPFATGELFGGLSQKSDEDRLAGVASSMGQIAARMAEAIEQQEKLCQCDDTMAANRRQYQLPDDWREWIQTDKGQ